MAVSEDGGDNEENDFFRVIRHDPCSHPYYPQSTTHKVYYYCVIMAQAIRAPYLVPTRGHFYP